MTLEKEFFLAFKKYHLGGTQAYSTQTKVLEYIRGFF
jgi:hypothetical protein